MFWTTKLFGTVWTRNELWLIERTHADTCANHSEIGEFLQNNTRRWRKADSLVSEGVKYVRLAEVMDGNMVKFLTLTELPTWMGRVGLVEIYRDQKVSAVN